jgi:hypothetical protein
MKNSKLQKSALYIQTMTTVNWAPVPSMPHISALSSEIYVFCEIPDHAWRVMNLARVGAQYVTLAKFMTVNEKLLSTKQMYIA